MVIIDGLLEAVSFLTVFKYKIKRGRGIKLWAKKPEKTAAEGAKAIDGVLILQKSIKYFPLAGLFIGLALMLVFYVFSRFLPVAPAVLTSLFFLYVITGGLHFDGLSDTADGLSAYLKSGGRNRFYSAMKDVNTGISGTIALIFYVLIMLTLLSSLAVYYNDNGNGGVNLDFIYLTFIAFPVVGRYSIVLVSYFSGTPENFKGTGTIFTEGTGLFTFLLATIFAFALILFLLKLAGLFALLVTVLVLLAAVYYFGKTFGGVNGDMLGFCVKISEIVFITALSGFHGIIY